jgi:secreted Zn-dependent insulinase-like peptidase
LEALVDPKNLIILVADKDYEPSDSEENDDLKDLDFLSNRFVSDHNDLYRLDYSISKMSKSTLQKMASGNHRLHFKLPPINEYIPSNFELKT